MNKESKITIKQISVLSIFLVIILASLIGALTINNFTNNLSNENLTFTGNQNITRYLSLPYIIKNVTKADMNLSGYPASTLCYQETANQSTAGDGNCGLNYGGSYFTSGSWSGSTSSAYDGNWNSFAIATGFNVGTINFYVNYTKPANANGGIWSLKYGTGSTYYLNSTIPNTCLNSIVALRWQSDTFGYTEVDCYNGTGYQLMSSDTSQSIRFYEEAMIWNVTTTYPTNPYLEVGTLDGNYEWSAIGIFGGAFGNGSDGELIFTTTTKSYGNLVLHTDYEVTGNTLYLMLNRVYQFTNVTLGSGTILSTQNTTGNSLIIKSLQNINISGTVNLSGILNSGNISSNLLVVDNMNINAPNVAAGGNGGSGGFLGGSGGATNYGFGGGGGGGGENAFSFVTGGTGGSGNFPSASGGAAVSVSGGGNINGPANSGSNSSGGSGSAGIIAGGTATSGAGGNSYSGNGGTASCTPNGAAGGGGGAGGIAGKPGINLYIKATNILLTGTIISSGTNGGNGGNGGNAARCVAGAAGGGAAGGGGGGGNGGNIYMSYIFLNNSASFNLTGGSGGVNGSRGTNDGGGVAGDANIGQNGTSGTIISFNSSQIKTSDFSIALFNAHNNTCSCVGCIKKANTCEIPFLFHSDTAGILNYNLINDITYDPATIYFTDPTEGNNTYLTRNNILVNVSINDTNYNNLTTYLYNSSKSLVNSTNSILTYSQCYQESANTSNQDGNDGNCSLNYNGAFSYWGNWYFVAPNGFNDGNWNIASRIDINAFDSLMGVYINYSKPGGASSAIWQTKLYNVQNANYTMPNSCFNLNPIQLKLTLVANSTTTLYNATFNCFNGTQFIQIGNYTGVNGMPVEEAMIWNISSINSFTNFTNLADGLYYFNVTKFDLNGNNYSTETRQVIIDTTQPSATLLTPQNNMYINNSNVNFTANLSDAGGLSNYTIFVYNTTSLVNQTTILLSGELQKTVSIIINLIDNSYNWFINVFNAVGNLFTTQSNAFILDTINPSINFISTTEANNTYANRNNIFINVSVGDANFANLTISVYNSSKNLINKTFVTNLCYQESANTTNQLNNDGNCSLNYTGTYNFNDTQWYDYPEINDGDWVSSKTYNRIVSPSSLIFGYINYTKPLNALSSSIWQVGLAEINTNNFNITNLTIPNSCWNYNSNKLSFAVSDFFNTSDTSHALDFYCLNSTSLVLMDSYHPQFPYPQDWGIGDEAMVWRMPISTVAINLTNLPNGLYYFNASTTDLANNQNSTETRQVTLVTASPPSLISINATNNKLLENEVIQAYVLPGTNDNLSYCNFTLINPSGNILINNINGTSYNSQQIWNSSSVLLNQIGIYNMSVNCLDLLGFTYTMNSSFNVTYNLITNPDTNIGFTYVVTQAPDKTKIYLTNISLADNSNGTIVYNFNSSISQSGNFTMSFSNNSITLDSNDVNKFTTFSINASSSLSNGVYNGNISITNSTYNLSYSIPFTFNVNPPAGIPTIYNSLGISQCTNSQSDSNCAFTPALSPYASMLNGNTIVLKYIVNNTGFLNLTNCSAKLTNDFFNANWVSTLPNNFSVGINQSQSFNITLSPVGITPQPFVGYVTVSCVADAFGDISSGSNSNWPYISVNILPTPSPTPGPGGGGGGTPVNTPTAHWTMATDSNNAIYQLKMTRSSSRDEIAVFQNLGTTARTIKLTCEDIPGSKSLCADIYLAQTQFDLPVVQDLKTNIPFTVKIPSDLADGTYSSNIVGTDDLGNKAFITVQVEIGAFGVLTDTLLKFSSSKDISGIKIPYVLIGLFAGLLSGFILYLFLKRFPWGAGVSIILALLIALVTIAVV